MSPMLQEPLNEKVARHVIEWLLKRGFEPIKQNWTYCQGNVDIIACKYNQLHFIGITTKKYPFNGLSCEGITRRKLLSLLHASQQYLKNHPHWKEVIIDVLTVMLIHEEPASCRLTKNIQLTTGRAEG